MSHRMAFAAVFAAAGLMTSAAYAGSPYYDADGQSVISSPAANPVAPRRSKSAAGRLGGSRATPKVDQPSVASAGQPSAAAVPRMDPDGFMHKESDTSLYEHATGSDGSVAESEESVEAPKPQPVYNAPMPKMDADGFIHKEGDSSLYEHATGSDGSVAESEDAVEAPKPQPVYTAAMPKMDADGFIHKESNSSYYGHASGSDGSP